MVSFPRLKIITNEIAIKDKQQRNGNSQEMYEPVLICAIKETHNHSIK